MLVQTFSAVPVCVCVVLCGSFNTQTMQQKRQLVSRNLHPTTLCLKKRAKFGNLYLQGV